jgi:energy-coupling factor transporter ATP-binding protein EcfA2
MKSTGFSFVNKILQVKNLTYTYPDADRPALSNISLQVKPGECVCITGHSGCGKSTLLLAIKGLLHDGEIAGEIIIEKPENIEEQHREMVGLVFQNAETQILCSTVAEEIAFGPENLCVPQDEIGGRIESSLKAVNLEGFWDRNVERMSAGQKHRLAIASILSMDPALILLDEPTSQLDLAGKNELGEVLRKLKERGYTLLIVEHNLSHFVDIVDRYILMNTGHVKEESSSMPAEHSQVEESCTSTSFHHYIPQNKTVVFINGLNISYPGVGPVLRDINVVIQQGELVHLFGRNGAGKSSLLRCLAGVTNPDSGDIEIVGLKISRKTSLLGKAGFLFQNPQRQLFENTVFDEVAFSLKRLNLSEGELQQRVMKSLEICEAGHLVSRLPLSLSFGEQHRVALASVLAPDPAVLLLDEPFAGLDIRQRMRLMKILLNLRNSKGTTVLIASHDPLPDPSWAERVLTMENGKIV